MPVVWYNLFFTKIIDSNLELHTIIVKIPQRATFNLKKISFTVMTLDNKEKLIALIANGIAVYSLYQERDSLPENTTLFDFVLKAIPDELKSELNAELIDEVFEYVSSTHSS